MRKLSIGVVYGGRSGEHEVSKLSAKNVMQALEEASFSVVPIFIDKNGRWLALSEVEGSVHSQPVTLSPSPGVGLRDNKTGRTIPVDVYFPVLHGTYGEDGTIQGLFEMAGVPYVGAGVLGSAICMDKEAQKLLFLYHGIPTPHFEVVHKSEWEKQDDRVLRLLTERVGFPCFVKPVNLGSSVGVSKVTRARDLHKAVEEAFKYDVKILIEESVQAREVDCAVIGNEAPQVSLPGEIIPKRKFFDYRAKYLSDDTEYRFPVPLKEHLKDKVMGMTAKVYEITFCEGMARVEFLLTKSDDIFVLEINTIPGCTSHSIFPRLWGASGKPFPEVVSALIDLALERWKRKQSLKTTYKEGRFLR